MLGNQQNVLNTYSEVKANLDCDVFNKYKGNSQNGDSCVL